MSAGVLAGQGGAVRRNRLLVRLLLGVIIFLAGGTILYVSLRGL